MRTLERLGVKAAFKADQADAAAAAGGLVGAALASLAGPEAAYIVGAVLDVGGGYGAVVAAGPPPVLERHPR